MTQEVANFFVSEARRNAHLSSSIEEEDNLLIYNWPPQFTGKHDASGHAEETDFEQAYFFPNQIPGKESRVSKKNINK